MNKLSNHIRFADELVNVRFAAKPAPAEKLIVFIPGGPGISGKYMDPFAQAVGLATITNVGVLDLPNHDGSRVPGKTENLKYSEVRGLLLKTIEELAGTPKRELVLVGHSLGALIAMDLVGHTTVKISKVILANAPTSFDNSPTFVEGLRKAGVADEVSWPTEAAFSSWWTKVIPLYFERPPTTDEVAALNSETFWRGNEHFSDDLPPFAELVAKLKAVQNPVKFFYVEGEYDRHLPLGNFEKVQSSIGGIPAAIIPTVGHFAMFEAHEEFTRQVLEFINAGH